MVGGEWLGIIVTFDITFGCGWQWVCMGMGIEWFGSGRWGQECVVEMGVG